MKGQAPGGVLIRDEKRYLRGAGVAKGEGTLFT